MYSIFGLINIENDYKLKLICVERAYSEAKLCMMKRYKLQ